MSAEDPTPVDPADISAVEEPDAPNTDTDGTPDDAKDTRPGREAARYRVRLREAETARDEALAQVAALTARLDTDDSRRAEELAAEHLADPRDLWAGGITLADLRAEDGTLDADLVAAATERLTTDRPHWRAPLPNYGGGNTGAPETKKPTPSWSGALRR